MDHNDMIIGSRVQGGTAEMFETGDWRSLTPSSTGTYASTV